jgi:Carboxypeptidase regulatory-like domain
MRRDLLPLILVTLALGGCFPYHFVTRPGISGTVVDEVAGVPIANATVILRQAPTRPPNIIEEPSTATDANGKFQMPPKRMWWIWIVTMENWPSPYVVEVRAPGYADASLNIQAWETGPAVMPLGRVRLRTL